MAFFAAMSAPEPEVVGEPVEEQAVSGADPEENGSRKGSRFCWFVVGSFMVVAIVVVIWYFVDEEWKDADEEDTAGYT